ncbi:MAG: HAD family phosphatase [Armatimonadetes bacterium]|nr:HAD family phosphatase [Armatimonadota bacterium]
MIKGILFDLDGTLIDSEPWHKKAELEAFHAMGLAIEKEDISMYVGTTLPRMLEDLNARFSSSLTVESFTKTQKPILSGYIARQIQVFPDVLPFLPRIRERRAAIVTSSVEWYVEAVRKRFAGEIGHLFETLVCERDVVFGKPHPEPFLLGASRLGLETCDCAAFEDSVNGVRSAKAAGCYVIGVDRERHGHLVEAEEVVGSLADVRL